MRLSSPLTLLSLCAALASACGEDNVVVTDVLTDTSQNDTSVVGAWSLVLVQPTDDQVYPDGGAVAVALTLASTTATDYAGFAVEVRLDDAVVATALAPDTTGHCSHTLSSAPGYGPHTIKVDVTGPDGITRSAERTILVNSPPPTPTVTITPSTPTNDADLTASVAAESLVDASRLDGAPLTLTYRWHEVGGPEEQWNSAVLDHGYTSTGKTYEVFVRVSDGWATSLAGRAEVTIGNAAPTCSAVLLTPAAAHTTQDITCRCSDFDDPEGDADQSQCVFTDLTTDTVIDTDGSCTLPASELAVGMSIGCTLAPSDGNAIGSEISSREESAVLVLNSPPGVPVVHLDPAEVNATTEVSCVLTTPASDPDGDTVTYSASWTVAGLASIATTTTVTPSALDAKKGDSLCCVLTATDGAASTPSAPACATLGNAPPDDVTVFVTLGGGSPPANRRSTLVCAPQSPTDPDGDPLSYSYEWYADGTVIAGATGAELSAANLSIGTVITCIATICDSDDACTAPITSKIGVTLQNAPPAIADVTIVDDDGEALPGETLTCTYEGWDDPDGDPASVSYAWIHVDAAGNETVLSGEAAATLLVSIGLPEGDTLICRVTPLNGAVTGTPVESDPIVVGDPIPVAPTVRIDAPDGADGVLTCTITDPGEFIPSGATYTYHWSLNGSDAGTGTTLAADKVDHCDLARCWVVVTATDLALMSNQPSSLMPLGSDCDDHNPCTASVCLAAGGCNAVPQDGSECDDGDPCTSDELCDNGTCVGTVDVCVEDRLSIQNGGASPFLAPTASAGYIAHWYNATALSGILRHTDGNESRFGDETRTFPTSVTRTIASGQQAVSPNGKVAVVISDNSPLIVCNCPGNYTFGINLRRFAADLATYDDIAIGSMGVGVTCTGSCFGRLHEHRSEVVAFSDDSFGALSAYQHPFARSGIRLRGVGANLALADEVTIIAAGDMSTMDRWDAALVPDGSDSFVVAWVGAGTKTVYAQRFAHAGSEIDADPIAVATVSGDVSAIAVTALTNGRFVVAWEAIGADAAGVGIAGQRFDEAGSKLGTAFVVPAVESGDQRLGGIAPLPGYKFVVTYRDAATPTPRQTARIFSAGAVGTTPIVLNEASTTSTVAPSVVALSSGEWVVAWVDTAGNQWTRRYTADGELAPRAAEFRANRATSGAQETPAAAGALSGHVMVAFASNVFGTAAMGSEIVTRVFDADGVEVRAEDFANTFLPGTQSTPAVAAGADRFVVAWNSEEQDGSVDGIFASVFDDMGDRIGAVVPVNTTTDDYQRQPSLAMAADGTWIAVWNAASTISGSLSDVIARVFLPAGTATAEVRVNELTAQPQERPVIAAVPFATEAVVAWQSKAQDGDGYGIFVRKLGFDGQPIGSELQVNTTTAGDQSFPTIAVSQTGFTLICWESAGQGPSARRAIVCRRLKTATLVPQGGEFLPLSRAVDQVAPVVRYQANGRIAIAFAATQVDSDAFGVQLVRVNDLGAEAVPHLVANRTWTSDQLRPFIVPQDDRVFVGWQSAGQDGSDAGIYFRVLPFNP